MKLDPSKESLTWCPMVHENPWKTDELAHKNGLMHAVLFNLKNMSLFSTFGWPRSTKQSFTRLKNQYYFFLPLVGWPKSAKQSDFWSPIFRPFWQLQKVRKMPFHALDSRECYYCCKRWNCNIYTQRVILVMWPYKSSSVWDAFSGKRPPCQVRLFAKVFAFLIVLLVSKQYLHLLNGSLTPAILSPRNIYNLPKLNFYRDREANLFH